MKVLNFGSMNIDHVYQVDHIVQPGETESSARLELFCGGKGFNQSVALAKAGVPVYHAGLVGTDGGMLLEVCEREGVRTDFIREVDGETGHAIIQIDRDAQNCILLFGGANQKVTVEYIDEVLAHFSEGDILLLQNEINELPAIIDRAHARGMQIILNPSPFNEKLTASDLTKVSLFLINEVEGEQITGESEPEAILDRMRQLYPQARVILTLGGNGSVYMEGEERIAQPAISAKAVDTTAAGDTFTGYFIASILREMSPRDGLLLAARAAAITVTRAGAAEAIPTMDELEGAT